MKIIIAQPAHPRRRPQRVRPFLIASLAAIVLSLVASAPTASASGSVPEKNCIEVKEDYDLRNAARDSNVFLIVHESGDKAAREAICDKVKATPEQRWNDGSEKGKGATFAFMELKDGKENYKGEWEEGNRSFAKSSLDLKNFPSFLFVSKGMDGFAKYSSHVTHYKGGAEDSIDMSDVEKFIEKKVGFRVGNDVFNIIFFDSIAAKFVSYGDAEGMDRYKQRFLQGLVRVSTLFSWREPFSTIGKLYNRAFSMSFEHGMGYTEKQAKKLQKKMESKGSSMPSDKAHELQQKLAILKSFAEPKELTAEDDKQIFIHSILHVGLLVATLLLFIFPGDDEKKETEEKEGEEVINAEPVEAKLNGDDDDKSTKKTK